MKRGWLFLLGGFGAPILAAASLAPRPGIAAQTCTAGNVMAGYCIPWRIWVDPASGLPVGSSGAPLYTAPAPGGGSQHVTVDNPSQAAGGSPATVTTSASLWWTEVVAGSVGTAGVSGPSRSSGAAAGQAAPYAVFRAEVASTAAGTLTLVNEAAPALAVSYPVQAGQVVTGSAPAFGSNFHASFVPTTAATVSLAVGFTAN